MPLTERVLFAEAMLTTIGLQQGFGRTDAVRTRKHQ
jgi:hypothetical protein